MVAILVPARLDSLTFSLVKKRLKPTIFSGHLNSLSYLFYYRGH